MSKGFLVATRDWVESKLSAINRNLQEPLVIEQIVYADEKIFTSGTRSVVAISVSLPDGYIITCVNDQTNSHALVGNPVAIVGDDVVMVYHVYDTITCSPIIRVIMQKEYAI